MNRTAEPRANDGVVKPVSNSLLEVALPDDGPPGVRKVGSGQQLAQARAAAGLSVEVLAGRLRLSTAQVLALDAERWDQLPDRSFVRAALRAYARQIEVDVTPLIDHVGGFGEPAVLEPTAAVQAVARGAARVAAWQPGKAGWREQLTARRWWIAGCGCAVLLGLVLLMAGGLSGPPTTARVQSVPIPGVTAPPGAPDGNPPAISTLRPAINTVGSMAGQADSPASEPIPTIGTGGSIIRPDSGPVTIQGKQSAMQLLPGPVSQVAKPAAQAGDGRVRVDGAVTVFPVQMPDSEPVHVHFSKRVWIDITHKDGVKLLSGTQDANQSFKLDGTPPMQVQIGNPSGVTIEFRGQLIDLKSKTNDKGVASFTLS